MGNPTDILSGSEGIRRCWWCGSDPLYVDYHDHQWGLPVGDDRGLFEKMCLEGFQAGLSWLTILRKRTAFRTNFDGFDFHKVAAYDDRKIETLVADASIIRHRGKIRSTINNAAKAIEMVDEFGSVAAFFWQYEPTGKAKSYRRRDQVPSITGESTAMSKALKKRGWTFVGPTTCYALMQATGMVNDHLVECHCHETVARARENFARPRSK